MKTVKIVFFKEMRRILFDRKMVFALFIMPVLMMIMIFGLMAVLAVNMLADISGHVSKVYVYQAPEDFKEFLQEEIGGDNKSSDMLYDAQKMLKEQAEQSMTENTANIIKQVGQLIGKDAEITYILSEEDMEKVKEDILIGEADMMIAFPEDFFNQVRNYKEGSKVPQIKTFYNPSEDYSSSAKETFSEYLEKYRRSLLKERVGNLDNVAVFTVDTDNKESVIQDDDKAGGKMLGRILPYMICMLLFAGVMSLGTDTITGEKERGTLAPLLIAPVKRSHIVYGKLMALMALSAMSAMVYGISMLSAFPVFAETLKAGGMSFHISGVQAVLLLLLIISLVFVYVAIIAVCAAIAKNMKEASTYLTPAYLLVIALGMMTMFVTGDTKTSVYIIPLYGSSMALRNVLTQEISNFQVVLAIITNLILGAALAAIVTKCFDNENLMFDA